MTPSTLAAFKRARDRFAAHPVLDYRRAMEPNDAAPERWCAWGACVQEDIDTLDSDLHTFMVEVVRPFMRGNVTTPDAVRRWDALIAEAERGQA